MPRKAHTKWTQDSFSVYTLSDKINFTIILYYCLYKINSVFILLSSVVYIFICIWSRNNTHRYVDECIHTQKYWQNLISESSLKYFAHKLAFFKILNRKVQEHTVHTLTVFHGLGFLGHTLSPNRKGAWLLFYGWLEYSKNHKVWK